MKRAAARDAVGVLLLVGAQGSVFLLNSVASLLVGGAMVPVALVAGVGWRRVLRRTGALTVILLPILVLRLAAVPTIATAVDWAAYGARLVAAVLLVELFLRSASPAALSRGISALARPLPPVAREVLGGLIASVVFVMPLMVRTAIEVRSAARLRLGGHGGVVRRTALVSRAIIAIALRVPAARAEAMVVRGLPERR